jgi:hypothetical protein
VSGLGLGVSLRGDVGGVGADGGLSLNFSAQRYALSGPYVRAFPSGWSFTRASTAYAQTPSGAWVAFAADAPRITERGLLIETAITNKVTCENANPTVTTGLTTNGDVAAVLSVVSDTAALAAAGLDAICTAGNVFELDNTLGVGTAGAVTTGMTGNTNPHTVSLYARMVSGTGTLRFIGADQGDLSTSGYARAAAEGLTPTANTSVFGLRVAAGAKVRFILLQMEERATVSSPVVTAGSTATRAADVPLNTLPAGTGTDDITVKWDAGTQTFDRSTLADVDVLNLATAGAGGWLGRYIETVTVDVNP